MIDRKYAIENKIKFRGKTYLDDVEDPPSKEVNIVITLIFCIILLIIILAAIGCSFYIPMVLGCIAMTLIFFKYILIGRQKAEIIEIIRDDKGNIIYSFTYNEKENEEKKKRVLTVMTYSATILWLFHWFNFIQMNFKGREIPDIYDTIYLKCVGRKLAKFEKNDCVRHAEGVTNPNYKERKKK